MSTSCDNYATMWRKGLVQYVIVCIHNKGLDSLCPV